MQISPISGLNSGQSGKTVEAVTAAAAVESRSKGKPEGPKPKAAPAVLTPAPAPPLSPANAVAAQDPKTRAEDRADERTADARVEDKKDAAKAEADAEVSAETQEKEADAEAARASLQMAQVSAYASEAVSASAQDTRFSRLA